MGNCLHSHRGGGRGRAVHCGKKGAAPVQELPRDEDYCDGKAAPASPVKEVKIRITRKQLEELLRRLDQEDPCFGGGAVISELLCMTSSCNFRHRTTGNGAGQWMPALQTIAE
ncbi:uncharacterized protein LOC104584554 [Brachypodium distachyon]|uniref:Uncharacterized protein n=1 Tax=Brachypodium distachyon TaxID=15368 RepID=I1GTZ1_BRADI|nr:uncharacterized protein LOC104584554 [Brachypodium distachyon]KQK15997.1 hypothetical protein BRADI_1g26250v3 [Brachypodium distachyon]|eukprot:XP_010237724.1 uncharacterized protein LOC104584554 [Brachypodium distachyon]